jgi:OmpA-OmpF porin, OOP family
MEPAATPGAWNFNTGLYASWAHRPLVLRNQQGEVVSSLVQNQLSLDAIFNIGITSRAAFGLVVPAIVMQHGDDNEINRQVMDQSKVPNQAFGDLGLVGKVVLIPGGELGGFGLSALGRFTIPTGNRDSTLGDGSVTSTLRLLAEYRLVGLAVRATTGIKIRTDQRTFAGKTWGDELPWGVGVGLKPQMFGWDSKGHWEWVVESHGFLPAGPDTPFTTVTQTPVYAGASARYSFLYPGKLKDSNIMAGFESSLSQAAGAPPVRVVIQFGWAPRVHDKDGDGIEDALDDCVNLAEDKDGFQDTDGCPEGDNDDDGVGDDEDKCPMQQEDEDGFEDDDGCPDPDNDKDGIPDVADGCPDEAGPPSTTPGSNGCPNKDQDGDGIQDDVDKCPDKPEDKDGFEDDDGCPDLDNDKDGIPDTQDACPNTAGIANSDSKLNGCPWPDKDGDAILDADDKCPNEAENYNGFQDEDGCPEKAPAAYRPLVEVVTRNKVTYFKFRVAPRFSKRGGTEVDPTTLATLRAVDQLYNQHPKWRLEVSVRPPPGKAEQALVQAKALAGLLIKGTPRGAGIVALEWQKGKTAPQAEISGISVKLLEELGCGDEQAKQSLSTVFGGLCSNRGNSCRFERKQRC